MQARAGKLGDLHEHKVLADLIHEFGPWDSSRGTGVYCVDRGTTDRADLADKARETAAALRTGADVVFQATFFDGEFLGYADFLVREECGLPGVEGQRYAVWDTKLARHAKVGALLQLTAYGDQLISLGLDPAPRVTLVLGNMERSSHSLADLLPVYRERRARFRALTGAHRSAEAPVAWQQPAVSYCGRCDYCAEQVARHRDLLMVAGMTSVQRKKLVADGITTIDALADLPLHLATGSRRRLREQARMQTGREAADGSRSFMKEGQPHTVTYRVLADNALGAIPAPSDGDIFFDFEGDPLWQDPATGQWGLEYLFGVVEAPRPTDPPGQEPVFRPFWAHSRAGERQAFLDFLAYVEERRARYPDMHVYHYAPYEKTALRNLSLNHVAGEDVVDSWLRDGLLVDLYATVRHSLRISEASYSIKKLEPLYMGDHLRSGDVKDAGSSVVAYAAYCEARDAGPETQAEAAAILASISDYNQYDCLSTLRLRDWLLQLRGGGASGAPMGAGASGGANVGPVAAERTASAEMTAGAGTGGEQTAAGSQPPSDAPLDAEPSPEEASLHAFLDAIPEDRQLTPDEQAVALVAAATGYHRRERKQFWWEHFDRLESEVDRWRDQRNVFVVEAAEVVSDWAPPTARARTESRTLRLTGIIERGLGIQARFHLVPDVQRTPCRMVSGTSTAGGTRGARPASRLARPNRRLPRLQHSGKRPRPLPATALQHSRGGHRGSSRSARPDRHHHQGEVHGQGAAVLSAAHGADGRPAHSHRQHRGSIGEARASWSVPRCQIFPSIPAWTSSAGPPPGWPASRASPQSATTMPATPITCPPSPGRWSTLTGPTSRCRALRERAKRSWAPTSLPGLCGPDGRLAWWASLMPSSRTCSARRLRRPAWTPAGGQEDWRSRTTFRGPASPTRTSPGSWTPTAVAWLAERPGP